MWELLISDKEWGYLEGGYGRVWKGVVDGRLCQARVLAADRIVLLSKYGTLVDAVVWLVGVLGFDALRSMSLRVFDRVCAFTYRIWHCSNMAARHPD